MKVLYIVVFSLLYWGVIKHIFFYDIFIFYGLFSLYNVYKSTVNQLVLISFLILLKLFFLNINLFCRIVLQ